MGLGGIGDLCWPVVVAHRGASAAEPENTLAAFLAAVRAGADVVELDVRLTADGVPVIMHDPDVAATTDGAGHLHELTLDRLRALDASGGRGLGLRVPTFREALEALTPDVVVDAEIKHDPGEPGYDPTGEPVVEAAVRVLDELGVRGRVLLSSFNPRSIARARELAPGVATGLLTVDRVDPRLALAHAVEAGHGMVLPQSGALLGAGAEFVAEAHAAGIRVGTWTVDDPETLRRLFERGVDAVATNDPAAAVPLRDAARSAGPQV